MVGTLGGLEVLVLVGLYQLEISGDAFAFVDASIILMGFEFEEDSSSSPGIEIGISTTTGFSVSAINLEQIKSS